MEQNHKVEILEEVKHEAEEAEKHDDLKKLPIQYEELKDECMDNEILRELFLDMIDHCLLYTESVIEFQRFALKRESDEENTDNNIIDFGELDNSRKIAHDATIDSINILARKLKENAKNSKWVTKLSGNRSAYGRFAILMAFARMLKDPNLNN